MSNNGKNVPLNLPNITHAEGTRTSLLWNIITKPKGILTISKLKFLGNFVEEKTTSVEKW
jgi:hypothetical protein